MAFPAIHWGNFGDEKVTSTAKINGFPLGIKMVLPDGREYVHARNGGTAMVASQLYQAMTANIHLADTMYAKSLVPGDSYDVGATTVAFTTGGTTAVTADRFMDGWVVVANSATGGTGYAYKIKSNNSAASGSATCTLTLYETDGIKVAWLSGTTRIGVLENPNNLVTVTTADTVGHPVVGVACNSAAASAYVWLQTKGVGAVKIGGTVLNNREPIVASTGVAGVVAKIALAATTALVDTKDGFGVIGVGLTSPAANGVAAVDIKI